MLAVAAEQRVPEQDRGKLVNSTLVAVLADLTRGTFVVLGEEHEMRATIRGYLATTARRIVWEQRHR